MTETEKEPTEKLLISVPEFAKRMNVSKPAVYMRLKTVETPGGDIVPELIDNRWKIDWHKYKDFSFKSVKRRTAIS